MVPDHSQTTRDVESKTMTQCLINLEGLDFGNSTDTEASDEASLSSLDSDCLDDKDELNDVSISNMKIHELHDSMRLPRKIIRTKAKRIQQGNGQHELPAKQHHESFREETEVPLQTCDEKSPSRKLPDTVKSQITSLGRQKSLSSMAA